MSQNYADQIKEAATKKPTASNTKSSKKTVGCLPITSNPATTTSVYTAPNIKDSQKTFIVKRKKDDKINKKTFQTVMEATLLKELDALAKKSGYSRNEMVNMMIEHCVKNFEIED